MRRGLSTPSLGITLSWRQEIGLFITLNLSTPSLGITHEVGEAVKRIIREKEDFQLPLSGSLKEKE
jgi:hypothetical protein